VIALTDDALAQAVVSLAMAWIKVPSEHHPIFHAALPKDARVETQPMFGGVAARVNGNIFAGLFGRSVMLALDGAEREAALALEGAGPFDPMGDGRARSQKVMLPEAMMDEPAELRRWIGRAFDAAAKLPRKAAKLPRKAAKPTKAPAAAKSATTSKAPSKSAARAKKAPAAKKASAAPKRSKAPKRRK
jgi:TfoX/Sxy family transcriptional regulator of competence genes